MAGPDGGQVEVAVDEGIRESSLDGLAKLSPAFRSEAMAERFPQINWSITAGNSSQITDGAAALLITSAERAMQLGLRTRARIHSMIVEGDDPLYMLTDIIPATRKLLARNCGPSLSTATYLLQPALSRETSLEAHLPHKS